MVIVPLSYLYVLLCLPFYQAAHHNSKLLLRPCVVCKRVHRPAACSTLTSHLHSFVYLAAFFGPCCM